MMAHAYNRRVTDLTVLRQLRHIAFHRLLRVLQDKISHLLLCGEDMVVLLSYDLKHFSLQNIILIQLGHLDYIIILVQSCLPHRLE